MQNTGVKYSIFFSEAHEPILTWGESPSTFQAGECGFSPQPSTQLGTMVLEQHRTTKRQDPRHVQPLPRPQARGSLPQGIRG